MENQKVLVRPADYEELARINEIRRYVNDVHVAGRPDTFRPGFCSELEQILYKRFEMENWVILAEVLEGELAGFASVEYVERPETPYNRARKMYHLEEFGVDPNFHRRGAATALVAYMKQDAAQRGYPRIELDMWEFNQGAFAFYENVGFQTYRRYMELWVDEKGEDVCV